MDEDIIEGEVIDPEDPWMDSRIAFEVEDFQERMDEMKQTYLFAADMISRGAFSPPQHPEVTREPDIGFALIRICGNRLIAVGNWLVAKCPAPAEEMLGEQQQKDWAWADQANSQQPVRLPMPDINRVRSL